VDFGLWDVAPALLVIPLDTHIARMARNLGLTARRDLSWRTAEEITASLRRLDPVDPVKYDFALCHFGMSGACPSQRRGDRCVECVLRQGCGPGSRIVRLRGSGPGRLVASVAAIQ
jgi:endonuclease III